MNRSLLQKSSKLKPLNGPEEISEAKKWVAFYTADNAAVAALSAQAPGADELALSAVQVIMATTIINVVYGFNLSSTVIKNILTGIIGHTVGTRAFSKLITWIPGLGNAVNAIVAGGTTAALGSAIIEWCEAKDKERKRGKKIDDILNGL